ncbi:MAG TPA: DUF4149 domain-containing protein [Candidatus Acidoferrales bacterium]
MTTILRFAQVLLLGTWVGAILFVGLSVAPAVFGAAPTRQVAGEIVGQVLYRLHVWVGYTAGLGYLIAAVVLHGQISALARPAAIAVMVMLLLTAASQHGVTPKLADLRAQMTAEHGSIDQTPADHPARAQFGRLHGVSSLIELVVLLAGLLALFLTIRDWRLLQ